MRPGRRDLADPARGPRPAAARRFGNAPTACGGDDCDDRDATRYPGRPEICDSGTHDEDCDPNTFGFRDTDRDGVGDAKCCNVVGAQVHCGTDCDDHQVAIVPGAVVCNGDDPMVCTGGQFEAEACYGSTVCIPQPNHTGVCGAQPSGYVTPPTFRPWRRPSPKGKNKGKNQTKDDNKLPQK